VRRKTVCIREIIPIEIYYGLLELGNGELTDGIQEAMHLAYVMEELQKSQTNEEIKIWRRMFDNLSPILSI